METLVAVEKMDEGGYVVTHVNHLEQKELTPAQVAGQILRTLRSKALWDLGRVAAKRGRQLLVTIHHDDDGFVVYTRAGQGATLRFQTAERTAEYVKAYLLVV